MLSFKEFIKESEDEEFPSEYRHNVKGWMSPHGNLHVFDPSHEHGYNIHPMIAKRVRKDVINSLRKHGGLGKNQFLRLYKSSNDPNDVDIRDTALKSAMNHGYARLGHINGEYYIHYDKDSEGGRKAALHALNYLKPKALDSNINITDKPWPIYKGKRPIDRSFTKRSAAANHIVHK